MTHPWAFGWDGLVAIGTLSLAGMTGWLAWTTRRVARADLVNLRAQWRPILVPDGEPNFAPDTERNEWTGRLAVQNTGRGPALYVRATLDPVNNSPDHWSLGSVAPGQSQPLTFSHLPRREGVYQLLLDYRDLGGYLYSSAIVIDFVNESGRYYDVKLFEDSPVTQLGDSLPQSGLRPVGPSTSRSTWTRLMHAATGAARGAKAGF